MQLAIYAVQVRIGVETDQSPTWLGSAGIIILSYDGVYS